jgi:glyoxylase-like metal-dependent hydrolase (beta-lactamase superfamily II)
VLGLADARGVRVTHVFETHLHNDYVTGGLALARLVGAAYHVSAADTVAFDRVPVHDGDAIEVSPAMSIRVLATPGFGSFCSTTQAEGVSSTIGRERAVNPVLTLDEGQLRDRDAGRPGHLPRLLRAHGPGQRGRPGRPGPFAAGPRRRRRAAAADRGGGVGGGPAGQPLRSYPVADFAALAMVRRHRPVTVVNVRRDSESRFLGRRHGADPSGGELGPHSRGTSAFPGQDHRLYTLPGIRRMLVL